MRNLPHNMRVMLDYAHICRKQIGQRIRAIRTDQKLSLRKLGMIANVDYTYLFDIEHAKANATVDVLARIASSLDVELWELVCPEERTSQSALPSNTKYYCIDMTSLDKR